MRAGLLSLALTVGMAPGVASGGGFFDGVPARGYVREDVAFDVLAVSERGGSPVATVRYLRLVLDVARRDVATDLWPQREMLLVERATGERLVFERLSGDLLPADPRAPQPRGRIAMDSGGVLEVLGPVEAGAPSACAGLDTLVRFGSAEIPLARDDLNVPTVRLGIGQLVSAALSAREIDGLADTVPILLRAQPQGLPTGPLTILETLFPGRNFGRSTAALTFRVSSAVPVNPASPPWSSITMAPELVQGVPVY